MVFIIIYVKFLDFHKAIDVSDAEVNLKISHLLKSAVFLI